MSNTSSTALLEAFDVADGTLCITNAEGTLVYANRGIERVKMR